MVETPETLRLFLREPQAGHLQVLAADSSNYLLGQNDRKLHSHNVPFSHQVRDDSNFTKRPRGPTKCRMKAF